MEKSFKRIIAFILGAVLTAAYLPASADVAISGEKDDTEVKEFLFTRAMRADLNDSYMSSWDMNQVGGKVTHGSASLNLDDTSTILPVEAHREIEPITYGEIAMSFNVIPASQMRDASIQLRNGTEQGIYIGLDSTNFWVDSAEGRKELLPYKTGATYNIYTVIHMEKKTFDIYVDYHLYAEGVPYTADRFDNFFMTTGNASTGKLTIRNISIRRGYWIDGNFTSESAAEAYGWTAESTVRGGGVKFDGTAKFVPTNGVTSIANNFGTQTRDFTADFWLNINKRRKEIAVALTGDGKNVVKITVDENGFYYEDAAGRPVEFFGKYMENLPYLVTIHVNFSTRSFDLYVNDKLQAENIALKQQDAVNADTMTVTGGPSAESFEFSAVTVYPTERFDDYVSEAQKVESPGVDIGMQYFNLWDEYRLYGWDTINASEYRRPINGFFDETNTERMDWDLKYMAEHGVDFMWFCSYPPSPVERPGPMTFGDTPRYYFRAKNSDKVQFALLLENAGWAALPATANGQDNMERYLQNVGRHMIEYYFKDPRYYTTNGRPLVGVYNPKNFRNSFGAEYAGEFVKRLGDMCEAEGIGRPIFVAANGWQLTNDEFTDTGLEGRYEYHLRAGYPKDALAMNRRRYNEAMAAGVGYIPNVDVGFDDYSWYRGTGFSFDSDWLKWSLEKTKEEILPLPNKFETPILNLATWSEYGEGHYFAPTTYYGFRYLDAVRDVFTEQGGEHEDLTPNEHQKDRFNNQYPHWRTVPLREVNVGEQPAEDSYEKYKWDFDDPNALGWKSETVEPDAVSNGVWTLTTGRDAMISLTDAGVDTSDVTHIRVRMKSRGTGYYSTTRLTTPLEEAENPKHAFNFAIPITMQNMTEFEDYYIPVGKYPEIWRSTLNSLSITFGGYEAGDKLEIDSIAFMATPQGENVKINIDGWSSNIDVTMRGNSPMVKLRDAAEKMGAEVYYDAQDDMVYILSKDVLTSFKPGEKTVVCGDKTHELADSSELIGGATWIDPQIVSLAFGKNISWNEKTKTLTLTDNTKETAPTRSNSERVLIYEEHFDGAASISYTSQPSTYTINGSAITMTSTGTDPQIVINVDSVDITDAEVIEVGMMSNTSIPLQVFFATAENTGITESKSYKTQVGTSNAFKAYSINTTSNAAFGGHLTRLRIDPGNIANVTVSIDYIRVYGGFEKESSQKDLLWSADSRMTTAEGIVWNFDINNGRDGWLLSKSLANASTTGGVLQADIIGTKPFLETPENSLEINAEDYSGLEFCLKNSSGAEKAKIYFITDTALTWTENKCVEIPLSKEERVYLPYYADFSELPCWKGKIKGVRIAFAAAQGGTIGVDYIKLTKNSANDN